MAIAMRFTTSDESISKEQYDKIAETVNRSDDPPPGLIFHSTGFTEGQAHTFDIWESEAAFQAFMQDRLQPELEKAGITGSTPDIMTYPVHNLWAADLKELERLSYEESPIAAQRLNRTARLQSAVKDVAEKATGKAKELADRGGSR